MVIKLFQWFVKFPKIVILLTLCLTAFFILQAKNELLDSRGKLIVDSTVEPFMARGSGAYAFFKEMRKVFGNEEVLVVAIKTNSGRPFELKDFLMMETMTHDLEKELPNIQDVISLTNTPRTSGVCSGNSYFHVEEAGSVCESVLEKHQNQLNCLANKDNYPSTRTEEPLLDDDSLDLEGESPEDDSLDLEGDSFDADLEDPAAESEQEVDVTGEFICTGDIFSKTGVQLYNENNEVSKKLFVELQNDPLIIRDLLSPDFKTAALVITFNEKAIPSKPETQLALQKVLSKYYSSEYRIAYSGQSRMEYLSSKTLTEDIVRILPWSLLLMMITLFFSFKSLRGVLIPLSVVVTGILWTFGFLALTGFSMNLVTMVLPPLLICVGSAYIIHFMNQYFRDVGESEKDKTKQQVINKTLKHITVPLTVTALTTLAGFAALTASPIPAVKEMGAFACFGIAMIIFLCLTFAPSVLLMLPAPKSGSRALKKGIFDAFLVKASRAVGNHSRKFIAFWLALGVFAFLGLLQVTVDSESKNFADDSPIEMDLALVQEELAGTSSLRLVFNGKENSDVLQTAATIYGIQKLKHWLMQKNGPNELTDIEGIRVDKVYTVVEYVDIYRNGLDNLKDEEVVSFFKTSRKRNFPKYLSDDDQLLQLNIRMKMLGTTALLELRELLNKKIPEFLPQMEVKYTGSGILSSESADNIAKGQVQSIVLALAIIFVILSLLFMSPKMGLVALYPNIIAIAVFFGTLGWISIPIGVTISIIASIALGIGVDDTIHFLSHFNENVNSLRSEKEASMKTLRQTGKPMIYTTISLGLGFVIFYMADMESQVMFGVLTAYTLLICLITDLNFLPSIMVNTKLITAWDYLGLKIDRSILQEVDLFENMTLRETKLATLMSYVIDLEPGEILFKERDVGNELYVILNGSIDIYLDQKFHGKHRHLAELVEGQSFGEMGLFRHSKRAASAAAGSKARLLAVNEKVLIRLQKRYPKVATKLFINLSKSLSKSIKDTSERIAEKRVDFAAGLSTAPQPNVSLKEVVDEIIADGVVTYEEQRDLDRLIFADHQISAEEQKELDRLNQLIEEGVVIKHDPVFVDIFQNFSSKQHKWIHEHFEVKQIPSGVRVFSQGDYGDYMLVILKGKFNVEKDVDGVKSIITTIFEGNIIGAISALCSENIRTSSILTVEDSEVIFISLNGLKRMNKMNYKLAARFYYNIVCMLSDRLEEANTQLFS
ncbi:MAG: MMPL family transporter [Proteobacteria bacterium]|nr:MMPL family transporter [Pseudomonadota bacterium]